MGILSMDSIYLEISKISFVEKIYSEFKKYIKYT